MLKNTKHELTENNGLKNSFLFLEDAGATVTVPGEWSSAPCMSGADFAATLAEGKIPSGGVYRLDGVAILNGLAGQTVSDITIIGDVTVTASAGLTLSRIVVTGTLKIESPDVVAEDCYASSAAIYSTDVSLKKCTVPSDIFGQGENTLIALCVTNRIALTGGHNNVCLLNRAKTVSATDCRNLYICENEITESMTLTRVAHLVANGNSADVTIKTEDVTAFVGNNVTDINERPACGINASLLPQVDKDAFIYMSRKKTVHEAEGRTLRNYLMEEAATKPYVIVAPGAYSTNDAVIFENLKNGCVIYAYGVLMEKETYSWHCIAFRNSDDITIKGMQIGHAINTTAQGIVVGKSASNCLRIMPAAGFPQDWTDPRYYNNGVMYHYKAGHPEFNMDGIGAIGGYTYDMVNGEIVARVSAGVYDSIAVGDTVSARGKGSSAVNIHTSSNIYFEDVTLYGSAGFAFNEFGCRSATVLHRVLDTPRPAAVLNQATYERYRTYERIYGVSFGLTEETGPNGETVYRGTPPICSSVDATHTTCSKVGTACISCTFESMCDDGTNQNAQHGRLHGFCDNGDGTVTVAFKTNISTINASQKYFTGRCCAQFEVGDRVYIYTSAGKLICDTPALSASRTLEPYKNEFGTDTPVYEVTVAKDAFDTAGCEGYPLTSDIAGAPKILIDNMSCASNGFVFDNMFIQYVRSRGLLIKASNGIVRNCTFYKCGKGCIAILYEIQWGESGVSEHLTIKNNCFDSTGYLEDLPRYSPIGIEGMGNEPTDEYLLYNDIVFEGNKVVNRGCTYAVFLNSARQIKLINNDFGLCAGEDEKNVQPSVYINCAKDVELSGNRFSPYIKDVTEGIVAKGNRNIFGTDIGDVEIAEKEMFPGMETTSPVINPPKVITSGLFDYTLGPWSAGCLPIEACEYLLYPYLNGSGWYAADMYLPGEDSTGGIEMATHLFSPQPRYNVGYGYRAEKSGKVHFGLEITPAGRGPGLLAIFKNGTMIWPTAGGDYTKTEDWAVVDSRIRSKRMSAALAELLFDIAEGDEILFVGKKSRFNVHPIIAFEK